MKQMRIEAIDWSKIKKIKIRSDVPLAEMNAKDLEAHRELRGHAAEANVWSEYLDKKKEVASIARERVRQAERRMGRGNSYFSLPLFLALSVYTLVRSAGIAFPSLSLPFSSIVLPGRIVDEGYEVFFFAAILLIFERLHVFETEKDGAMVHVYLVPISEVNFRTFWYIGVSLFLFAVTFLRNDWGIAACWIIPIFLVVAVCVRLKEEDILDTCDKELTEIGRKAREDEAAQIKKEISEPVEVVKSEEPHRCSICQVESLYEVCLTCDKQYKEERHRIRFQILRAKQAGVPATLTLPEWLHTLQTFGWKCAYCYGPFQCMEHYIPIVEGGGTTADNCFPACFACNSKKSGNHPELPASFFRSATAPKATHRPKKPTPKRGV